MKRIAAFIGLFALLEVCCQFPADLAGGSASEGEARVVGWAAYSCGGYAADALVRIRPAGFLKDTIFSSATLPSGRIRDLRTDQDGRFCIDSLDTGVYAIEIIDYQSYSALIRCHIKRDTSLASTTLNPSGTIAGGSDPFSEKPMYQYVQVYDLDRALRIDSQNGAFTLRGVPQGTYALRLLPASPYVQPEVLDSIEVAAGAVTTVRTGEWAHATRISLNTTWSGAGVEDPVYNFPVLIRLTGNNFDFSRADSLGNDIRFAKADGAPLSFEIEEWDPVTERAEVWVKVDTVFGNNGTQYFTMYWGNAAAKSASNSASVFDTAVGFQGVWHFRSSAAGTSADATYNAYQGTLSDVVPVQGIIGEAYAFDGSSSRVTMENTASSALNFPQSGRYAVSAWVNKDASAPGNQNIVAKGFTQYTLRISNGQWQFIESENRVPYECETSQAPATYGEWVHLCGIRDGAKQYLYVNGVCADSTIDLVQGIGVRLETYDVEFGRTAFPDYTPTDYFKGQMDEVRLSTAVPTAGWIKLCYMNQRADDALTVIEKRP
jgi:hypothetical protein